MARSRRAFTLIELLVVVSIIALLVSILLPSLREAREAGKRTVCLTNMRQIGTAESAYHDEYADIFPWFATYEYYANRRTNQSWFFGGRYPPLRPGGDLPPYVVANHLRYPPEQRPFNEYLYPNAIGVKADTLLYRCPSEDGKRWVTPIEGGGEMFHDPQPNYLVTGVSYNNNWWWMVLNDISTAGESGGSQSSLGLLPDYANKMTRYKLSVRGAGIFVTIHGNPLNTLIATSTRIPGWHKKLAFTEMLFLDGHADFLLTDATAGNWAYRAVEWTMWWNEAPSKIPPQFVNPYPGIENYDDTHEE